jgi:hypothetical protein
MLIELHRVPFEIERCERIVGYSYNASDRPHCVRLAGCRSRQTAFWELMAVFSRTTRHPEVEADSPPEVKWLILG